MNDAATLHQVTSRKPRIRPRAAIALLCAIALAAAPGCTTTRTFDASDRVPTRQELKSGTPVTLSLRDGSVRTLDFVAWKSGSFVGKSESGETVTIDRDRIATLEVTTASTVKTLALIGAVMMVVGLLVVEDVVDGLEDIGSGSR